MTIGPWKNSENPYREDIQGVRAIGAILIAIYHIWVNKVSGGVDVFFVISGFLMTGVLIRQIGRQRKIQPLAFWGNLITRIAPSAYTVLLATLLVGFLFIPEPLWLQLIKETIYSALNLENIRLMQSSVDYLARELPPSPDQQFWALSIQVQFYFILPILLAALLGAARVVKSKLPIFAGIGVLIAVSLVYSILETRENPASSYFNPAARAWEFFAGAMLAFLLPYISLGRLTRNILGFLGISFLLLCGILIPEGERFPGYIAAVPVSAALMLIMSGTGETQSVFNRFLSHRYFTAIGNISFGIYLWHWPLLVFTLEYTGASRPTLPQGMGIIALSVLLAMATHKYIEEPIRNRKYKASTVWTPYLIGIVFLTPVLATAATWTYYINSVVHEEILMTRKPVTHAIAKVHEQNDATHISEDHLIAVKSVLPDAYEDNCHQDITSSEVISCDYGDTASPKAIALVGGSHATQWLPALNNIGKKHRIKVINITKNACPLGELPESDPSCAEWNRNVVDHLAKIKPLAVITNSTRSTRKEYQEHVPASYIKQWKILAQLGIQVIAIRDNPSFEFDVATCVARHMDDALACSKPREQSLSRVDPSVSYLQSLANLRLIDMSDFFCTPKTCVTVSNDLLMYRDAHHLDALYVVSLTEKLQERLAKASPEIFGQ